MRAPAPPVTTEAATEVDPATPVGNRRGPLWALAGWGLPAALLLAASIALLPPPVGWLARVPLPLLGALATWRFIAPDTGKWRDLFLARTLKATGFAASLYLLVRGLDEPPLLYDGWSPLAFLARIDIALGFALLTFGFMVYNQYPLAFRYDREGAGGALAGTGLALLSVGGYLSEPAIAPFVPSGLSLALAAPLVLAVLVLTPVIHLVGRREIPYASAFCRIVGAGPGRNLALVLPLATYLAYRTHLQENVKYLNLYEWALGLALLGFLLHRVKAWFKRTAQDEPAASRAKRHVQVVSPLYDPRFATWDRTIQAFVDRGESRDRYETLWEESLRAAGLAEAQVARTLGELREYRDLRQRFLPLPWRAKALAAKNRERRLALHRDLVARFTTPLNHGKGKHHG